MPSAEAGASAPPAASRLTSRVVPAASLSPSELRRLFTLYAANYDETDFPRFAADLAEKDWVILLQDSVDGSIRGFSTQKVLRARVDGRDLRAIFSGDTLIDPAYWGEQELVRGWCRFAGRILAEAPGEPLYWFLISKGHRTYLYLPLFFRAYWPRFDGPTPPDEQAVLDSLARAKFGAAFDPARGILRFDRSLGQLKPALAEVPSGRRDDPRVRFFLQRNPGYARGEELVCLTIVSTANMRGLALRTLREGLLEGPLGARPGQLGRGAAC